MPYKLKFVQENNNQIQGLKLNKSDFTSKQLADYKKANLPEYVENVINYHNPKGKQTLVVDKGIDSAYLFTPDKKLLFREAVITGSDNGTTNNAMSMKKFFELNNTDDHQAYFSYLKNHKQRITPEGKFYVGDIRTNTAENPARKQIGYPMIKSLAAEIYDNGRNNKIHNDRLRDYGSQQRIVTMYDISGVGQNSAIHGTDNPIREKRFKMKDRIIDFNGKYVTEKPNRKISNGCINVDDDSNIINSLSKGDNILIGNKDFSLSEKQEFTERKYNLNPKYSKYSTTQNNNINEIRSILDKYNIPYTDDQLAFIQTVREKESKSGTSLFQKLESNLPYFIAHSQGQFQINPKTFKQYLPENYDGSLEDQVLAVSKFYSDNNNWSKNTNYKDRTYLKEFKNNNLNDPFTREMEKEIGLIGPKDDNTFKYELYNTGSKNLYNMATIKFDKLYRKNINLLNNKK